MANDQKNQNSAENSLKVTVEASNNGTGSLAEGVTDNNDLVEALKAILGKYLTQNTSTSASVKSKKNCDNCWE